MNPRPDLYRPATAADLIGHAATVCRAYTAEIDANRRAGIRPCFKLLLLGLPGIGKSQCASILASHLAGDPMNYEHLNGTDISIERIRQIRSRFGLASLFGEYQGVVVDELENASRSAQIDMLTTLDKLPGGWFFIGTTNQNLDTFEDRFQTRFEQVVVSPPAIDDIRQLLAGKFAVPDAIATQLATLSAGNVRAALIDAKQWFTANPQPLPVAA